MGGEAQLWLVVYDIADDRRRARMAAWLLARGNRVQESVFELSATPAQVGAWMIDAQRPTRFSPAVDSLRCYPLCAACCAGAAGYGKGPAPRAPGKAVVT